MSCAVLVGAQHHGAVVLFGKFVEQCHLSVTDELQRFGVDWHRCVRSEGATAGAVSSRTGRWWRRRSLRSMRSRTWLRVLLDVEGGCGLADERMQQISSAAESNCDPRRALACVPPG
ncbi:MAG: hypothetical protein QOF25_1438 [Mycobacterium sp.]|nr:hypothetical protein [Mycobacterium sp.]